MIKKILSYRIVRIIIGSHLALLILLIAGYFYLKVHSHNEYEESYKSAPYDAIIVPGYPFNKEWDPLLKMRITWSAYLWNEGIAKHIIYSGGAVYSPYVESIIMKLYAIELGIPDSLILTDSLAQHSTENLYYSYRLAESKGFHKIAVATDPFQDIFLEKFAADRSMDVDFLPVQYGLLKDRFTKEIMIDPRIAFRENFVPITKKETLWNRLRGTMGKNISEHGLQPGD